MFIFCMRYHSGCQTFSSNFSKLIWFLHAIKDYYLYFRGRLKHGRHFTFKSVLNDVAITLVSSSVVGSIAEETHPYAAHGPWLQVLFTDDFIEQMLEDIGDLCDTEMVSSWEECTNKYTKNKTISNTMAQRKTAVTPVH